MNVGNRIRDERKARRLSQEALARRANVSLSLINQIERGLVTDPHLATLRGISSALDISIAELLEEPANPKARSRSRSEVSEAEERRDLYLRIGLEDACDCTSSARHLADTENLVETKEQFIVWASHIDALEGRVYATSQRWEIHVLDRLKDRELPAWERDILHKIGAEFDAAQTKVAGLMVRARKVLEERFNESEPSEIVPKRTKGAPHLRLVESSEREAEPAMPTKDAG